MEKSRNINTTVSMWHDCFGLMSALTEPIYTYCAKSIVRDNRSTGHFPVIQSKALIAFVSGNCLINACCLPYNVDREEAVVSTPDG